MSWKVSHTDEILRSRYVPADSTEGGIVVFWSVK